MHSRPPFRMVQIISPVHPNQVLMLPTVSALEMKAPSGQARCLPCPIPYLQGLELCEYIVAPKQVFSEWMRDEWLNEIRIYRHHLSFFQFKMCALTLFWQSPKAPQRSYGTLWIEFSRMTWPGLAENFPTWLQQWSGYGDNPKLLWNVVKYSPLFCLPKEISSW